MEKIAIIKGCNECPALLKSEDPLLETTTYTCSMTDSFIGEFKWGLPSGIHETCPLQKAYLEMDLQDDNLGVIKLQDNNE